VGRSLEEACWACGMAAKSLSEIHKLAKEIPILPKRICKSARKICISLTDLYKLSKELTNSFRELGNPSEETKEEFSTSDSLRSGRVKHDGAVTW